MGSLSTSDSARRASAACGLSGSATVISAFHYRRLRGVPCGAWQSHGKGIPEPEGAGIPPTWSHRLNREVRRGGELRRNQATRERGIDGVTVGNGVRRQSSPQLLREECRDLRGMLVAVARPVEHEGESARLRGPHSRLRQPGDPRVGLLHRLPQ